MNYENYKTLINIGDDLRILEDNPVFPKFLRFKKNNYEYWKMNYKYWKKNYEHWNVFYNKKNH